MQKRIEEVRYLLFVLSKENQLITNAIKKNEVSRIFRDNFQWFN